MGNYTVDDSQDSVYIRYYLVRILYLSYTFIFTLTCGYPTYLAKWAETRQVLRYSVIPYPPECETLLIEWGNRRHYTE